MKFEVSIEQFSGPLDLMLYLVKDKKLDLFDLNVVELADQYISFINDAHDRKLEIASEYLSELAGLIEYKSKKLLPRDTSEFDANDVEDDEENLIKRLIEYKRYKEVSVELASRFEERSLHFEKPVSSELFKSLKHGLEAAITLDQTAYDLMNAMTKVLERFKIAHPQDVSIERAELSIDDVIDEMRVLFETGAVFLLEDVLALSPSVPHFLVSFLAILDLIRMGEIKLQYENEKMYLKGAMT